MMRLAYSLVFASLLIQSGYAQNALRYDLVIHEIMADPSPSVGLPEAEYIEIKNRSGRSINLQGFRIISGTTVSGSISKVELAPGGLLILCASSQTAAFSFYGTAVPVPSFPSIANDGSLLQLVSAEGHVIHAIDFIKSWYHNAAKEEGGWSLEMVDSNNPCTGQNNWAASSHAKGGTPGTTNSIAKPNSDAQSPRLVHAVFPHNNELELVFDEPLDSTSMIPSAFTITPHATLHTLQMADALHRRIRLTLTEPPDSTRLYTLTVHGVKDCSGNVMGRQETRTGIPRKITPKDLVVNEILYHPKPDGHDYIELYNRSLKVADLSQLYLTSLNSTGTPTTPRKVTTTSRYLLPGSYVVLTEDAADLARHYLVKNIEDVLAVPSMPSYPNDGGTVILSDINGTIIDEVQYSKKWQFALIAQDEGVALERIDPEGLSQDAGNWHSAAATAGYGTPGYRNSQYRLWEQMKGSIAVSPKIFSPDNDGHEDFSLIQYRLQQSGFAGNVFIYNTEGYPVRHLVKNVILGFEGSWQWDGMDERGQLLPPGPYVVLSEFFNLKGEKHVFKNVVVLAGRR